jgi:hypothetical protein
MNSYELKKKSHAKVRKFTKNMAVTLADSESQTMAEQTPDVKEPIQPDYNKPTEWKQTNINLLTAKPLLIYNSYVSLDNIPSLIENIESKANSSSGLIKSGDVLVLTEKLLLWFSAEKKSNQRIIKYGGGLLSGVWELHYDQKTKQVKIKKREKGNTDTPNLLLPGSLPNLNHIGSDIHGRYKGSKVTWSIGLNESVQITTESGKPIKTGDYETSYGVFLQFEGFVTNSHLAEGFETITDTDPTPGVIGETKYILTYRIPARRPEIQQEVKFVVLKNSFGPVESMKMAINLAYNQKINNLVYASIPQLKVDIGNIKLNQQVNTYFKNSMQKEVYFYDIDKNMRATKSVSSLQRGKALMACVGSPEERVAFFCAYPNSQQLPNYYFDQFTLKVDDGVTTPDELNKYTSIVYNVVSDKVKGLTYPDPDIEMEKQKEIVMIMRYKLLNTPHRYDAQYSKITQQKLFRVLVR